LVYLVLWEHLTIRLMAVHDTLTGLPNRRLLYERLEQRTALANRYKTSFCLVYIDLDRFKPINDTYGHRCGDQVLCEVADRMRNVVRESDTVARVGGDEFVVLLPDTNDQEGAVAVSKNLITAIVKPIDTSKGSLTVSASARIGLFPENGSNPEELLAFADKAMYARKALADTPAGEN
jgi:diguanylate cyclase (GGDEF)-like protein